MAKLKTPIQAEKEPPKTKGKTGRSVIDWEAMFDLWVESGLPKTTFLKQYGQKPTTGHVRKKTNGWTRDALFARKAAIESNPSLKNKVKKDEGLWKTIQEWRKTQGVDDWKTADAIRTHIKLQLNKGIVMGEDGKPMSTIKPNDLRHLADCLSSVQRTQRLALGMSTDNVGVADPSDSNVEVDSLDCPTFIVEVSDTGKFKSQRPKEVA